MAGGKIIRITGGKSTTECESWTVYCEDFNISAGGTSSFTADGGTNFGEPQEPTTGGQYILKGYWTDENDNKITEALIGETVKFHVETKDIPNGKKIEMILFDDDIHKSESDSDDGNDQVPLYPSSDGKAMTEYEESKYAIVENNKAVKTIILNEYFSWLASQEEDKNVELFFSCSYKEQKEILPIQFHDYLLVKGLPKIIFVNGQWNIADKTPFGDNFGPTEPKKPYWVQGIADSFIDYLDKEISIKSKQKLRNTLLNSNELENKNYILYYDGSSKVGFDQSGKSRFENGKKFAEENFEEITNGLGGNEIYLVSHSEGGAYAAGMIDYLHEKGIAIGEHVLLSPDEGDEFSVNPEIPSYQLLYMYFSSVYNPILASIKFAKFRKWGNYYAIVDWVVNEHRVKGVTKMGIVHNQEAGWDGVHGWTNGNNVFIKVSDLKEVKSFLVQGEYEGEFYSGQDQTKTKNGTKFYRIDNEYIITNCPPLIEIK
ncbi:MAG: hypothetical protein ACK5MD_11125 [Flavobacteriales bacterium]